MHPSPPPGFDFLERDGARILLREGYTDVLPRLLAARADEAGETLSGGREPHPVVPLPTGERAVVRRYLRGGLLRHLNRDRYFLRHRAFDELRATERARAAGVRAPTVLAAVERPAAPGYTALLATVRIEGARDLAAWLPGAAPEAREAVLRAAGAQIAAMHAGGVAHADLNLRNLLVREERGEMEVWVLDFDRARVYEGEVPASRRGVEARRLARSARRLRAPVDAAGWSALREGYVAERARRGAEGG